jgi:GNAT superfamily N-acetyltransferase
MNDHHVDMVVLEHHDPADYQAIVEPLVAFNATKVGDSHYRKLAVLLKQPGGGPTIGGLWGKFYYEWLFVELLFVPEHLRGRGHGRELMLKAEQMTVGWGGIGLWLDTFDFQARGFYEKLGFSVFGEIGDHPRGRSRFFLEKRLQIGG